MTPDDPNGLAHSAHERIVSDVASSGSEGLEVVNTIEICPDLSEIHTKPTSLPPDFVPRLKRKLHLFKLLLILSLAILAVALIFIIALSVPHGILWKARSKPPDVVLNVTTVPFPGSSPVTGYGLGAAYLVLSTYFSPPSSEGPDTKVVYNGGGGKLCIRTKSGSAWQKGIQYVGGTNARADTPLAMLDWIGGPSIYFLTTDNLLSGIDHIPQNDSWKLSSLTGYKIKVHSLSQLASVACLNGTSAFVYYQDPDEQIQEFGIDDYRDQSWRGGSIGPLGLAEAGSGIGITRWLNGTLKEVEELFFQAPNGAIHARMYADSAWLPDTYTISGTPNNVADGASISVATVNSAAGSKVLLSYIAKSGFLNIQTRGTMGVSDYTAFNSSTQLSQESGEPRTGLAAVGSSRIYMIVDQKIVELSNSNLTMTNWTATDI